MVRNFLCVFFILALIGCTAPAEEVTDEEVPKQIDQKQYGNLNVTTTPSGAYVYVDGERAGKSPITINRLTTGWHDVMVEKEGYTTHNERKFIYVNNNRLDVVLE